MYKFLKSYILLVVLVLTLGSTSCENNTVTPEAKLTTIQDLEVQPGFAWYREKKASYKTDSTIIQELKTTSINDKIYLFVKPTCSCVGTQTTFPNFMRTIEDAGIPSDKYELYFMSDDDDKHPYQDVLQISKLPSFFVKKGNNFYSIIDSLNLKQNTKPTTKIEEVLLEALKN